MSRISASFSKNGKGASAAVAAPSRSPRKPGRVAAHRQPPTETSITVSLLTRYAPGWILDGESRRLSPETMASRRWLVEKLLWFLRQEEYVECGLSEIRAFLAYVSSGHLSTDGRWGNGTKRQPVDAETVRTYYSRLRTLFRWLVAEDAIAESPMERLKPPVSRPDQIQPFTPEQIEKLLAACRHPNNARTRRRDEAILLLLLDTGMRASELCSLRESDLDLVATRRVTVMGKGSKRRTLPVDKRTAKGIWQYLQETAEDRDVGGPVFLGDRGRRTAEPLTRSGLLQLIRRLGRSARIEAARCSPHTLRHTFAVEFLRAGGNTFSLMNLLGHTSLAMTNRYVQLAQADIENQHRQFSPVARLRERR